MSHRLAVMDSGHVAQVGTPVEVYEQPATAYVADFLGVANLLDADGERRRAAAAASCASAAFALDAGRRAGRSGQARHPPRAGARRAPARPHGPNCVPAHGRAGRVRRVDDAGPRAAARRRGGAVADRQRPATSPDWPAGTPVGVTLPADALRALPA